MDDVEAILTLDTEVQARLLDSVLTSQGIPHVMRSYHDSAYDGIFQGPRGWGRIEAPAEFREDILAIFNDLERESPLPEDECDAE